MSREAGRDVWGGAVGSYLDALGTENRPAALGVVRGLRAEGYDVLDIMTHLLSPAQATVGRLWVEDVWSVAQEHAATAISEAVMATLALELDLGETADGAERPLALVSCVEQEWHALPAMMVAEYLRSGGFEVSYLGANASSQHLVRHIHEVGPVAVLLSCSLSAFLPLVRRQIEAVSETGTPVVVGGSAFDSGGHRARALGATGHSASGTRIADVVRALPRAVPHAEPLTHHGAAEAYVVFGDREALADEVERNLLRMLAASPEPTPTGDDPWLRVLDDQMPHLVGSVAGALVCDDPSIIEESLAWVETVLRNRSAPHEVGETLRLALRQTLHDMPVATSMLTPR